MTLLLRFEEAAATLNVSKNWIRSEVKSGRLRAVRLGPRMPRIHRDDFLKFEEAFKAGRLKDLAPEQQTAPEIVIPKYPKVPRVTVAADLATPPEVQGIYFVWSDLKVVYVGKSTNLYRRVSLAHEHISVGDRISWLALPEYTHQSLIWAENFYIGACQPIRNYGMGRRESEGAQ